MTRAYASPASPRQPKNAPRERDAAEKGALDAPTEGPVAADAEVRVIVKERFAPAW